MAKLETARELVLCQYHAFDNRWKHFKNDLLDYDNAIINFWTDDMADSQFYPSVRRAKICRLPDNQPLPLELLFNSLDANLIEQLEFDQLTLCEKEQTTVIFTSLQVLSVDSVAIVRQTQRSSHLKSSIMFSSVTPRSKSPEQLTSPEEDYEFDLVPRRRPARQEPVEHAGPLATQDVLSTYFKFDAPNLFAAHLGKQMSRSSTDSLIVLISSRF